MRWLVCWIKVKRTVCEVDPQLIHLVESISKRIGLRRRVRLLVTAGRIGPAVVGLFRPTVLLPKVIVDGKSPRELEPILAHELIHIRRGDL